MKYYPTLLHEKAANKMVEIFSRDKSVMSILLTCSCARGKASKDSCLDICLIVKNKNDIKNIKSKFNKVYGRDKILKGLSRAGKYSHIDIEITDGKIIPVERGWTSGPDEYELEIGNVFIYSMVLFDRNNHFKRLRKNYTPYYYEGLRRKRLKEVKEFMFNNLGHVPLLVKRKLYFQAFKRFYDATREFLQALFIENKKYPIAYDKWVKDQLTEILDKPELYKEFVALYEIKKLESNELALKADKLKKLAKRYLP